MVQRNTAKSLHDHISIPAELKMSPSTFCVDEDHRKYMEYIMIPDSMLQARAKRLTELILEDYNKEGIAELTVICVMNGAKVFYDDLVSNGLTNSKNIKVNTVF